MSLGEGGATLVLESLDHLRSRAGRALVELLGAGSSCDASHMTAPQAGGLGAALAIERSLEDAGIVHHEVDLINAHATGTPLNDAAESAAFARVFGERARTIPVEATKGMLGHLLGTAGAIEAVSAVIGLLEKEVHPTAGGDGVDPALAIRLVHDAPLAMPELRTVVSVSLGFGGANAAVVLRETERP
jgi:3-oxoacyl-[acyl-carrier-protein] synthase II